MKSALAAGFGIILALWLLVGYQVTRRMSDVEHQAVELNVRYMQAQELLASVRSRILLGSVYVRDSLLDPDPDRQQYVAQIDSTYAAVDDSLRQYVPFLDAAVERDRVDRLRSEIREFRTETLDVLRTDSTRWSVEARALLRRLMPRREAAMRISDEVQALNRVAFVQQQAIMADIHESIQRQVWTRLGLALALSFAIALVASTYAGRLERRLREQRATEEQNAAALQRLSARLIDAQEEERRRIARELHDEVGQLLSAVKVELTLVQHRLRGGDADGALLDGAHGLADTALHAVRDLSHLLHPAALDDLGLSAALQTYVAEFARRHRVATDFEDEGLDHRLPADVEKAAYRIVQEALTNVARHAAAATCQVQVRLRGARLMVAVSDDGIGFELAQADRAARRGLGLVSIRERAAQLGGTVRIESGPGVGTRLTVELPVPAESTAPRADHNTTSPAAVPAAQEALSG